MMTDYVSAGLLAAGALTAIRLAVFCLSLLAHHRWHIPLADLERLISACFPGRRARQNPIKDRQAKVSPP